MADWRRERLGDHAKIGARIGWRGLSADEYVESGPFLIAGKHIASGSVDWACCDHLTEDRYRESPEIALQVGDVIISKDGTIGRVARIDSLPGPATLNGTMMLVRPTGSLDYRYLSHLLNGSAFKQLVEERISGSSVPHLFQRDLVTLPVNLPPLEEQRQIAEVLDTIDETIQATERVIAKLEMDRQAVSQAVFGKRSWHSALEVVAVGSLLVSSPRNGKSPHEGESWNGTFMLGLGCLAATGFTPQQLKWAPEVHGSLRGALLADGDLLMSRSNTEDRVGFVGRYRNVGHPCIYPDLMMRLVPSSQVSPRYLELALQSGPARMQMRRLASGTSGSMVKITGEAVSNMSVAFCSPADQARFCGMFDALSEARNIEELRLTKLRDLRAGVAADLLSGRVSTVAV